jgi:1,4-alpha-glucan branching enzyme
MRFAGKHMRHIVKAGLFVLLCMSALVMVAFSQETTRKYTVKNGRMCIELSRNLDDSQLERFINDFNLQDLALKTFIRRNIDDSLIKSGWKVESNDKDGIVISKPLLPIDDLRDPGDRIKVMEKNLSFAERFPAVNNGIVMGYNRFRNKSPFAVKDSMVTFYLRNNTRARRVMLAGSFNDWRPDALSMTLTDSGWIAFVKLGAGKWWYKFIVDGRWITDPDNAISENDGRGNINSVYYRPSVNFVLNGYTNADHVYLAGSFNNWRSRDLEMIRTATGWRLPLYLAQGTHTYKFVVDGTWMADNNNSNKLPDGQGGFNSVLPVGKPYLFKLKGYNNARRVVLAGSFNGWRTNEIFLTKTTSGWEIPYVLGPGNYEYKFLVDDKWISDPENPLTADNKMGNSFLIIQPNYTFRLKGFGNAKLVFLAGDVNSWSPNSFAMRKEGDDWVFTVHMAIGKHLYKYIVDGKWILDPGNRLWEQNEYGTGNSIVWISK